MKLKDQEPYINKILNDFIRIDDFINYRNRLFDIKLLSN